MININQLNEKEKKFYQTAVATLVDACALAGKNNVDFELKSHRSTRVDLRNRHNLHIVAWDFISDIDIALDENDNMIGWSIHRRKFESGTIELNHQIINELVKDVPFIGENPQVVSLKNIPNTNGTQYCKALIQSSADDYLLSVNSADLSIISVMPMKSGEIKSIPLNDEVSNVAHNRLWELIQELVEQTDPAAAQEMKSAFRLSLKRGGVDDKNTRFYSFQAQQYYSECDVDIDEDNDKLLSWYIEALKSEGDEKNITQDQALTVVEPLLIESDELTGPDITADQLGEDYIIRLFWWRQIDNIIVEGDKFSVAVNAKTGTIFSLDQQWRYISPELLSVEGITGEQALNIAEKQRSNLNIPVTITAKLMEKKIIEVENEIEDKYTVQNYVVWCVGFSDRMASSFTQLAVDHITGNVVRVTGW